MLSAQELYSQFIDHPSVLGPSYLYTDHILGTSIPNHEESLYTYHWEIIVKLCKGHKYVLSIQRKDYYKEFVSIKDECPTALYRREEMYYYADFDWSVLFKITYKVALETDVQNLQFTIIYRYIPCKDNRHL